MKYKYHFQIDRSIDRLENKWKNIKHDARQRDTYIKKARLRTGGGELTKKEKRIVDSPLYADIVNKLGISASGNVPRFDNDQSNSIPLPSKRLRNVLSLGDDNSVDMEISSMSLNTGISSIGSSAFSQLVISQPAITADQLPMTSAQARLVDAARSFAQHTPQSPATTSVTTTITTITTTSTTTAPTTTAAAASVPVQTQSQLSPSNLPKKRNRTVSLSNPTPRQSASTSNIRVAPNIRDVQMRNAELMYEHLQQQTGNNALNRTYLDHQIARAIVASEKEKISLEKEKIALEREKISLEREKILLEEEREKN